MKFLKKLENIFSAVAFAEAGEFETARQMAKEGDEEPIEKVDAKKHSRPKPESDIAHHPSRA